MNSLLLFGGAGISFLTFGLVLIRYGNRKIKMIGGAFVGIGLGICYISKVPLEWAK